ncbi:MAG: pacearchaeosortase [archaeon]|nr:pacearchaeosortase [archaeon]
MNIKESFNLLVRYIILVLIAFPSIWLFYLIFTPLTVYSSYFILSLFYDVALENSTFILNSYAIELIPACIAGSAYYLLLILNLTTPMKSKTRIRSISFLMVSFLVLNILRIAFFSFLFIKGFQYFDVAHKAVWYLGSTLLVVALWFVNVSLFKIKGIPVYSDICSLFREAFPRRARIIKKKARKR